MPIPNDNQNAVIPGAALSVNTLTKLLNKIDPDNADVEVALAAQALALFLQNQLGAPAFEAEIPTQPKDVRVLTAGNYTIPQGATAVLIEASGAGGGGAGVTGGDRGRIYAGDNGGNTRVVLASRQINITALGGAGGGGGNSGSRTPGSLARSGSTGGDVINKAGACGGEGGNHGSNNDWRWTGQEGHPGAVVTLFNTDVIGGDTLAITYGAGGSGGIASTHGRPGEPGWVRITIW